MKEDFDKFAARAAPAIFVLLWSTGFIGTKYVVNNADPLTYLAIRMALVVVLMASFAPSSGRSGQSRRDRAQHRRGHSGAWCLSRRHGGGDLAVHSRWPFRADPGSAADPDINHREPLARRARDRDAMGGLLIGLAGVALILHDRPMGGQAGWGWIASAISLVSITLGTLYQRRYCSRIDWRSGNLVQYVAVTVFFAIGAFLFEARVVHWTTEFIFALVWLAVVLSIGSIGLLYWLIRHQAATSVASLFYLVPAVTC